MKRYLIAVVFCLCLLLNGCASKYDEDAIHAYADALTALQDCTGMNTDIKVLIYEDEDQEHLMSKLNMNGAILKHDNDLQMNMDASVSANGVVLRNLKFYMKDANVYFDIFDTKFKQPLDKETAFFDFDEIVTSQSKINQEDITASIQDNMKEFRYQDQEAGIIAFIIQESFIQKFTDQSTESKIAIHQLRGTITIKDGQVTAYSFLMELDIDDQPYTIDTTIELSDFNQIKEIQFPDLSEFDSQEDYDVTEEL